MPTPARRPAKTKQGRTLPAITAEKKKLVRKTDRKGRVTLPASFADHLVIVEQISEDELRVRKAQALPRRYTLAELLAGVTEANKHGEIDFGPPVGNEAW